MRGDAVDNALELSFAQAGTGGIRRTRDQHAFRLCRPRLVYQIRRELIALVRSHGDRLGYAFHDTHEMAIAGIGRIGQQNLVITVHQQRAGQQQRCRAARRHHDALRCNVEAVHALVVSADGFTQRPDAERTGVVNLAAGKLRLCRVDDRLRRREIGLADLHVNHVAPAGFERPRMRGDLHHVERFDVSEAGG